MTAEATMKDRIKAIMEAQAMTQQAFASYLEISAATLSSIYTGRTQPSLNIVMAIIHKLPNISPRWLLEGVGEMYNAAGDNQTINEAPSSPSTPHSPSDDTQASEGADDGASHLHPHNANRHGDQAGSVVNAGQRQTPVNGDARTVDIKYVDKPQRHVVEIKVYYDDYTYESFVPSKKS